MDKCDVSPNRWTQLRKLAPTFVLVVLTALAGGTDLFSETVHTLVSKSLSDRLNDLMPYLLNVLLVATALNVAWVTYHPISCWLARLLDRWDLTPEATGVLKRAFALGYWALVAFFAMSAFAPDLMGKLAMGLGFVTAAVAWALNGMLNDLASGFLLRGMRCLKEGELVKVADVAIAEGPVIEIGWLRTRIRHAELGEANIPNSKIWQSPIAKKPKKELLVKP